MNTLIKVMALAFVASLAACQHTAPYQAPPQQVDPVPPTIRGHNTTTQGTAAARNTQQNEPQAQQRSSQQTQNQASVVITLHLAQIKKESSLVQVDTGSVPLYALPQPVLTQADIARVSPAKTANGYFLLLEMDANGTSKLKNITQQARGHYLLLSVGGQLVSVVRMGEVITNGRLLVPTQNPQHTQAIIRLMQGRS